MQVFFNFFSAAAKPPPKKNISERQNYDQLIPKISSSTSLRKNCKFFKVKLNFARHTKYGAGINLYVANRKRQHYWRNREELRRKTAVFYPTESSKYIGCGRYFAGGLVSVQQPDQHWRDCEYWGLALSGFKQ